MIDVGDRLLPSPILCRLGARGFRLSGPQPVVHHVVTARALALPLNGGFVGGLRPWDLPIRRHPSYAASIFCRFRIFTLRIHEYLQASHNYAERCLRIFALGRKNFLFAGHIEGAQNLAVLQSIVSTCRIHGVNPYEYIKDLLIRMQTHPAARRDELMPWNWKPPPAAAA